MGLVARVIEEAGIPTVYLSTGRDLGAQVMPPRSVFINFPMGNPLGRPHDTAMQRQILMEVLDHAVKAKDPGELIDLDHDWGEKFLTIMELKSRWKGQAPDPLSCCVGSFGFLGAAAGCSVFSAARASYSLRVASLEASSSRARATSRAALSRARACSV